MRIFEVFGKTASYGDGNFPGKNKICTHVSEDLAEAYRLFYYDGLMRAEVYYRELVHVNNLGEFNYWTWL